MATTLGVWPASQEAQELGQDDRVHRDQVYVGSMEGHGNEDRGK